MSRSAIAIIGALLLTAVPASGQEWAKKMFQETTHNFGMVAANAKTEYRFPLTNLYRDDVHISGVRVSCGCTTPIVTKDTLKSWEQGEIIAHFNTDRFSGQRGATPTVVIDRPQPAEVQLRVDGLIRNDVMISPGEVKFGSIDQGSARDQEVLVDLSGAGRQITQVKSQVTYVTATPTLVGQEAGRTRYKIRVHLAETSPPGYLNDQLMLVTNDASGTEFPLSVVGRVVPEVSISPSALSVGVVQPDQEVTKQLVVRAKRPFRILKINCDDPAFTFRPDNEAKSVHVVPVSFKAGHDASKVSQKIRIETDLGHEVSAELTAFAEVVSLAHK